MILALKRDDMGMTVLLVEQNAQLALQVAAYGYIMENGRIVLDGPPEKLRANERRAGILSRLLRRPAARACATSSTTSGARGGCRDARCSKWKASPSASAASRPWTTSSLAVEHGRDLQPDRARTAPARPRCST